MYLLALLGVAKFPDAGPLAVNLSVMFAAPAPAEASITLPDPSTVIVAAVYEPLADLIILGIF
jgi:hypothetical protein